MKRHTPECLAAQAAKHIEHLDPEGLVCDCPEGEPEGDRTFSPDFQQRANEAAIRITAAIEEAATLPGQGARTIVSAALAAAVEAFWTKAPREMALEDAAVHLRQLVTAYLVQIVAKERLSAPASQG